MQAKPWVLPYIAVQTLMVVAVHTSRILCSCAPSPTLEDIPNNTENKRCSASTPMWLHNSSVACELLRAHLMSNTLHDLLLTRSWPSVVDSSVLVGPPVPLCPSLATVPSVRPLALDLAAVPLRAAQTLAHLGLRAQRRSIDDQSTCGERATLGGTQIGCFRSRAVRRERRLT